MLYTQSEHVAVRGSLKRGYSDEEISEGFEGGCFFWHIHVDSSISRCWMGIDLLAYGEYASQRVGQFRQ